MTGGRLFALFLISSSSIGFEIALTRYFAAAKWSEYGYWVISIVMAGLALSGVAVALARPFLLRRSESLLAALPIVLIVTAALGYQCVTVNPFNPLQLQNPATWLPQLGNIGLYYAALLPFFFFTGIYVGLAFVLGEQRLGRTYGCDLIGAGAGALLVLALMFAVHPFHLVPALLPLLALAAVFSGGRGRRVLCGVAALLALGGSEALLLLDDAAAYNDFKAIYAPLHVQGVKVLREVRAPRGLYTLLDDFTERVDTDVSNDAGTMNLPGPPRALGVYRDGSRVAALPGAAGLDVRYAPAALNALPYVLRPHAAALLVGSGGGFRTAEARALGTATLVTLEPDPVLRGMIPAKPHVAARADSPAAMARLHPASYDVIDISADFLDEAEANAQAFAEETLVTELGALRPGGVLSIPVSIREIPAYAVRVLATVRAALYARRGDPLRDVIVYRSAWNARILVSNRPFPAADIAAARKFADDRSFDVSYYPGIDVAASRAHIYNDLPAVSFEQGTVTSGDGPDDALADEAGVVLAGGEVPSQRAFDLAPITRDRPFFYDALKLQRLGTILRRVEILPQQEIAPLVNLAVLAQALLVALIVIAVPLVKPERIKAPAAMIARAIPYFAALGLGFLFIEIFLIGQADFLLNDRSSAFALVLTGMLIFSGLGSMASGRFAALPRHAVRVAVCVILVWSVLALACLPRLLPGLLSLPWLARAALLLLVLAPVSMALGLPFPLGLAGTRAREGTAGALLPWAWGLNGAFSVVATPLANLISLEFGYSRLLLAASLLYVIAMIAFPEPSRRAVRATAQQEA